MFLLFLCYALLGSAIFVNKLILIQLPPSTFVALRMLFSAILLLSPTFFLSTKLTWATLKKDLPVLLLIPLCATYLCSLLKAYAISNLPATKAAVLGSLDPFATALLAWFFLSEQLCRSRVLGLAIGFMGALLAIASKGSLSTCTAWYRMSYPELAALLAVIIGRAGWMLAQQLLRRSAYTTYEFNGIIMLIGGLYATLTATLTEVPLQALQAAPYSTWLLLGYTVLIGNVVGYTIFGSMLRRYSSTFVSLAGFSVPFFVAVCDLLVTGQLPSPLLVGAMGLMVLGAWLFYRREQKISADIKSRTGWEESLKLMAQNGDDQLLDPELDEWSSDEDSDGSSD
jgi:drug/metabolite transporter (DMT)-like permease